MLICSFQLRVCVIVGRSIRSIDDEFPSRFHTLHFVAYLHVSRYLMWYDHNVGLLLEFY